MFDIIWGIITVSTTSDLVKKRMFPKQSQHKHGTNAAKQWTVFISIYVWWETTSWKAARSLLLLLILLQKAPLTLITKWYCWVQTALPNKFILKSVVVTSWSLWGVRFWLVWVTISNNAYSNSVHSGWFLNVCSFSLCVV